MIVFGSNLNAVQNPMLTVSVSGHHRRFHDVRALGYFNYFYDN